MFMLAEDIRSEMAKLGFRTFQEMVGRTDKLTFRPTANSEKAKYLDLKEILTHAWKLRTGINITGGSVAQNFFHEMRLVSFHLISFVCLLRYKLQYNDSFRLSVQCAF